MTLEINAEQRELRDSVRGFLARKTDGAKNTDESVWQSLVGLGLTEIPFPEEYSGAGFGVKDVSVVFTELGRALTTAPYLSSIALAGSTLLECATDAALTEFIPRIASGAATAALVTGYPFDESSIDAALDDDSLVLNGRQDFVVDGAAADLLVVVARGPNGPELAVVPGDSAGISRRSLEALDFTRPLARIEFEDVRVRRIGTGDLTAGLAKAQALALVAVASEQVGAARICLEMSVEYAKTRKQFDRAIGSFQSIKHRLSDMSISIELAEAAVLDAANASERPLDEFVKAVSIARVLAIKASVFAAEESIQIHGGIGFTFEHPLHNYFRRAKTSEGLFGSVESHLEKVAASL